MAAQASALTLAPRGRWLHELRRLAKIAYDGLIARRTAKREGVQWLADDRRKAYDDFLVAVQGRMVYIEHSTGQTGKDPDKDGQTDTPVPPSMNQEFFDALDRIRQLARHYSAIKAAEGIERALTALLLVPRTATTPDTRRNLMFAGFAVTLVLKGRMDEFTNAYREDLGLGSPVGAPKHWPIPEYFAGQITIVC